MPDPSIQQPDYTKMGLADQLNAYSRMAAGLPADAQGYDLNTIFQHLADQWKQDERSPYGVDEHSQNPNTGAVPAQGDGTSALGHHMAGWVDPTLQPPQQPQNRRHADWQHGFRPDQPYQQGSPANRPGAAQDAMQRGRGLYGWNPMDQQRGALSQMMARRPRQSNWDAYGY